MRRLAAVLLAGSLAFAGLAGCERTPEVDGGVLGPLRLYTPDDEAIGVLFLLSDGGGWSREMSHTAHKLAKRGYVVAGVDTARVQGNLEHANEDCHEVASAFEQASQNIQKTRRLDVYALPILAGIGEGGTLAVAALWQAGPETLAGATTVDFRPQLTGTVPLCADPHAQPSADGKAFDYAPPHELFGWWQTAWTHPPDDAARAFATAMQATEAEQAENGRASKRLLAALLQGTDERDSDAANALHMGGLDVVDLPGRTGGRSVAIILSGDGGWRDLDRTLGLIFAGAGLHVVGIDSLRYWWANKPPETSAEDLGQLIEDIAARVPNARIALIGYSFGADVLPALYNRLPAEARERVVLLSLLALGRDAHYEIHVEGWLGGNAESDAQPVAPELAKIDPRLVQCVYGADEADDSGCLLPELKDAQLIRTSGGHHFDEDYEKLAHTIMARIRDGR